MTRDEQGQIAGIEGVLFGVFVFAIGVLVLANAWAVIDAKLAAAASAREAARAFVESDGVAPAADAADAARAVVEAHGRQWDRTELSLNGAEWRRCAPVTATVRYRGTLAAVPFVSAVTDGFTVTASHREIVDPYRSGVAGDVTC